MPGEDLILGDDHKKKLDDIVVQMTNNKEPDEAIAAVVTDFKSKYGQKKNSSGNASLPLLSGSDSSNLVSKSEVLDSGSQRFNFATGKNDLPPLPEAVPSTALQTPVNESDLLRAAGTAQETSPVDQKNFDPNIAEQQQQLHPYKEAIARGVAQGGNYLLKAPAGVYDMIALTANKLINNPLNAVTNNAFGEIPSFKDLGNEDGIYKSTVSGLDEAVKNSTEAKDSVNQGNKVQDYFSGKNPDYSKGMSLLGQDLMEMIPTSIGLAFAISENPAMANVVGGGAFISDAKNKLDSNPNLSEMSEQDKSTWAALMGGTEMATENLGIPNLPIFKNILKKGGKEALDKAGKEFFDNTMGKVLKRYIGPGSEEVGSELLNNTLQNIYAKASGDDPNRKPFDNSMDTFIHSAALTGALSAPSIISDVRTKKSLDRTTEIEKHKAILVNEIQNPDVSDEVKPALAKRIQDLNEEASNIASDEKEQFSKLSPEQKSQVNSLLKKSDEITTSALDETLSKDAKDIFKKDLDEVDKKIEDIYKEAGKERESKKTNVESTSKTVSAEADESPAMETGLVEGEKKSQPIDITNVEMPEKTTDSFNEVVAPVKNEEVNLPVNENPAEDVQEEMKAPQSEDVIAMAENPDIFGERRKKKTMIRAEENKSYGDIVKNIETDDKFYDSVNAKKAHEHIDKVINEFESNGLIEDLANKMIEGKTPFHEKIKNMAAGKLVDRLRVTAEREGNEFQKNAINKLAAKLNVARSNDVNVAATQTGLEAEVAKMLPLSEEGLKEYVSAALPSIQDTYLDDSHKTEVKQAAQDINKLLEISEAQKAIKDAVESEINKIAEKTKGKEWVKSVNDAIDNLKIDLKDC